MTNKFLIKKIILTEKATALAALNKYTFMVEKTTNISEVKKAIKEAYNVDVDSVNVLNVKSKKRRLGRSVGKKPGYKKMIVTLKKGSKIDLAGV